MPAPEQTPLVEEGLQQTSAEACTDPGREPGSTATSILASVREQHEVHFPSSSTGTLPSLPNRYLSLELQFQRLTREPEVERHLVASR
uniref:Uncharacterized protein n=1 Tax=Monodelphis domestica TaxID=13616 RepID=A0A5F8HCA4_MONDO